MIKYLSTFWFVLKCLLVARKDNLTGFSTGSTGRSKNLDPTGAGRPDRFPSLPWLPPLGRQDSIFSKELHAKLRHAPPSLQVGRKL